jgi:hypothetical protein
MRPSTGSISLSLGVFVTSVLLFFSQGNITDEADGRSMYEVTKSIVERYSLTIPERYGFLGLEGKFYASHGFGLPLLSLLPYTTIRVLARFSGFGESLVVAAVASCMPVITGLIAVAIYRLARRLGAEPRPAILVAIGSVFGTYLLAYSKEFFSEPLATLFLVLAIDAAVARRPVLSGSMAAAAAVTRPQFFSFAPILVWCFWREDGRATAVKSAIPLCVGLLVALGYNIARFGDPTQFGYPGLGFTTPLLRGLTGVLFHPDKTVLLFSPVIVLVPFGLYHIHQINRTAFWLLFGNLLMTTIISTKWIGWEGGWVWGPRTLMPGIIPAIVPLASWANEGGIRLRLVLALFLLGFFISSPTLIVSQRAQLVSQPPHYGPNILRQIKLIPATLQFTREHLVEGVSSRARYEQFVNTWQVQLLRSRGIRGLLAALVASLTLVVMATVSARRLRSVFQPHLRAEQARTSNPT